MAKRRRHSAASRLPHSSGASTVVLGRAGEERARALIAFATLFLAALTEVVVADEPVRSQEQKPVPQIVPGSAAQATVVFVTRIINGDVAPLRAPSLSMHLPLSVPQQDISELELEGNPQRRTDRWGCPVAVFQCQELAPGSSLTGRWTAWASIRRLRWDLAKGGSGGAPLTGEEQALNLRNGKDLVLGSPVVTAAAEEAARGKTGTTGVLDGIFGLVMDRLSYDRDGKWDPAPVVLTSGKGSCSEYTYCFIALCRHQGIPARYAGGIVGRLGVPLHVDRVFHRFPQAYIPESGWVDFDPTRTERANNKRLYFGQTPGPMLLLSIGDGGEGSLTGSDYLESHSWQTKKTKASSVRQAWWLEPPSPKVRTEVEQFRRKLAEPGGEPRTALVEEALKIGDPFVLPWLDDLLYETASRVAAARACLTIGGEAELTAVINSLGRLNDAAGDREIGRALDAFTGQRFGSDRNKWNEWLKARTPRTPLPGDEPGKKS